jgi:hypothetical protein
MSFEITLPAPRATLAGCMWLPRIIAKARLLQNGALPSEYEARFCHPTGVDAQFLNFFALTKEDVLLASRGNDEQVASWFRDLASPRPSIISEWNYLAEHLGRPGFPMADRLPVALSTIYKHLDPSKINSVFEALEADEFTSS